MKYNYFAGCVVPQKENAYELSARKVAEKFGIEFAELAGSSCCGFFVDAVDHSAATILAARNLSLAEENGHDLLTLCTACYGHLTRVRTSLLSDSRLLDDVNKILGEVNRKIEKPPQVKHFTKALLEDVGLEKIRGAIKRPLSMLKVAPHYGCHILKPSDDMQLDNPENPKVLDSLTEVTGAECLNYTEKKLCCGAPVLGVDEKLSLTIAEEKLRSIKKTGADAIVTMCPFCHLQFDLNQSAIGQQFAEEFNIPVLHYTQLLGLALGLTPDELGICENRVPVDKILESLQTPFS